jgi:hypothetical protein
MNPFLILFESDIFFLTLHFLMNMNDEHVSKNNTNYKIGDINISVEKH